MCDRTTASAWKASRAYLMPHPTFNRHRGWNQHKCRHFCRYSRFPACHPHLDSELLIEKKWRLFSRPSSSNKNSSFHPWLFKTTIESITSCDPKSITECRMCSSPWISPRFEMFQLSWHMLLGQVWPRNGRLWRNGEFRGRDSSTFSRMG